MEKQSELLSTNDLNDSTIMEEANSVIQNTNQKQISAEIVITNSKHDNNGQVIEGTQDYQDEFTEDIETIRNKLKKLKAQDIKIHNIKTKFGNIGTIGQRSLPERFFIDLLTTENVEIIYTHVTIKSAEKDLYSYQIEYTATIDGKEVIRNLNGYESGQLYANFQVLSPYGISFDIEYSQNKIELHQALENFKFHDDKGVKEFLDTNSEATIAKQIAKYLSLNNLNDEKLTLKNQTTNSIELVADDDSPTYKGTVTLKWNLKLIELSGVKLWSPEKYNPPGLKGYIYLNNKTNKIDYFDYGTYLYGLDHDPESCYLDWCEEYNQHINVFEFNFNGPYHTIKLINPKTNEKKETIIYGYTRSFLLDYGGMFRTINFDTGVNISIKCHVPTNAKRFNQTTNQWESFEKTTNNLSVNNLGQVTLLD